MTGSWRVLDAAGWPRSRAARGSCCGAAPEVVQFNGPVLELMTEGRTRFDQRLARLGPDILAPEFDSDRFLRRLREDDPTRPIGDALLDQRTIAGIGNLWKAEGCFEAGIDPWRPAGRCPTPRRWRSSTPPGRACSSRRATDQGRFRQVYGNAGRPARAAARAIRSARPVGRQPHDLLVPGVSALSLRVGHKGADHIAPGNTRRRSTPRSPPAST